MEKRSLKERVASGGVLSDVEITLTGTNSSQWPSGTPLKGPSYSTITAAAAVAQSESLSADEEDETSQSDREDQQQQLSTRSVDKAVRLTNSQAESLIDAESKRSVELTERLLSARAAIVRRAGQQVHFERRQDEEAEAAIALRNLLADLHNKRADAEIDNEREASHSVSKRDTRRALSVSRRRREALLARRT